MSSSFFHKIFQNRRSTCDDHAHKGFSPASAPARSRRPHGGIFSGEGIPYFFYRPGRKGGQVFVPIVKKGFCHFFIFRFFSRSGSVEILFFVVYIFYFSYYEGDPLTPPEGEAAQGEHPLDPRFFINLLRVIAVLGNARAAGAEVRSAGVPKSEVNV